MAIFRPSPIVQSISGALGGSVFKQTRNGAVIAHRPATTKRLATYQTEQQAKFQYLRAAFLNDLTDAQRTAWRQAAVTVNRTNRLGQTRPLTALQLFIKQNMQKSDWTDYETAPGTLLPGVICFGATWSCAEGGPFTLSCTATSSTGGGTQALFARPLTARTINASNTWRKNRSAIAALNGADSVNVHSQFTAVWGEPAEDERIGIIFWRHGSRFLPSYRQEIWTTVTS